jgi:protein-disulfide isomerase
MGIVYEARHRVTGRTCALKVLDDLRGKADLAERFRREVTLATSIGHPGIAEVLDADVDPATGSFYIAMELLRGSTFRVFLESPDASRLRLLGLVRKLLEPLAAAHAHGVVHRDLKPDNVFVLDGEPERVKLLDFGIARNRSAPEITAAGIALGTPHYMSPEQAMDVRKCTAASDVWSVGVMLYEALSGKRPFRGESSHAVAVAICTHDHEPLSSVVPDIDPRLSALVDRCLDKEPLRRPKDAGALLLDLQRILATSSIAPPRPEPVRSLRGSTDGEPKPRLDPRIRGVIVACALVALSLGGAFYAAYRTGAETWLSSTLLLAAIVFVALFAVLSGFFLFDRRQAAAAARPEPERRIPVKAAPEVRAPAAMGPDEARVTIVFFVDYVSPKSRTARLVLERIRERHPDDVRVVWRHCPSTPLSARIAEAVVEAVHQGGPLAFFRASEVLLRSTRRLSEPHLEFVFTQLQLSLRGLRHALASRRHWLTVEDDRELACTLGIESGPAYVIDGRVFDGDTPEAVVFDAVEGLLARGRQLSAPATDGTRLDDGGALRVEQILVQWTAVADSRLRVVRSRAEARERAESLLRRAKMRSSDFQTLARTFSDAEITDLALDLKSLPTALNRFAASLRKGEMSDVLESERGFHILRRVR